MIVYKIKLIGLEKKPSFWSKDAWVQGVSVIPKTGGSGKTWTSKKLVNKNFEQIKDCVSYGKSFVAEIITFKLVQESVSKSTI